VRGRKKLVGTVWGREGVGMDEFRRFIHPGHLYFIAIHSLHTCDPGAAFVGIADIDVAADLNLRVKIFSSCLISRQPVEHEIFPEIKLERFSL
jgi:hypothetical protein